MQIIAGIDLGGTAINYTLADMQGRFLIDRLCEHPARAVEGPDICVQQIADGLAIAVNGFAQRPPFPSTTPDATICPSATIFAMYTPEP